MYEKTDVTIPYTAEITYSNGETETHQGRYSGLTASEVEIIISE